MTAAKISIGLKTFQDPDLIALQNACENWWNRFAANDRPCWLTLCGSCDTGKTHCGDKLWEAAKNWGRLETRSEWLTQKIWWPSFVNELRAGEAFEKLADTRKWPLLYLDEVGASRDTTGFVADQLYLILAQREKKWTIITTNLTFDQFVQLDERISSRCTRNEGIVVEVNTAPFSSRDKSK